MASDFDKLIEIYQFDSIQQYPSELELFDWLHDLKGANLLVLNYTSSDFIRLLTMVGKSGKAPVLAIRNINTVGEWGGIFAQLQEIHTNFAISQAGEFGIVEWHQ